MMRICKWVTNVLIFSYLSVIYFSGVPESNTLNARLKEKALKVAFVVGIWPSWSMFAPNPIKFDTKSYVEITYKNGKKVEYDVELEPTGILATFRKARWMKYAQDNLRNPNQKVLLKPALRHFAHKYSEAGNPVTTVTLKRRWSELHPFSEDKLHSIFRTPRYPKNEVLVSQKVGDL